MKANAIVYTSNTGFTKKYAEMLSKLTSLSVFSLDECSSLSDNSKIIYLGWLKAGSITGYEKVTKKFDIVAVCSVGMMCKNDKTPKEVRERHKIPSAIPIFYLQGGYAPDKLCGMNKFIMKFVTKVIIKGINNKDDKTQEDKDTLDLAINGGDRVSENALTPVLEFIK